MKDCAKANTMTNHLFESEVYAERRRKLAATLRTGIILLLGNEESSMNYADNCYPFRQDSSFLYYAGLDLPSLALIIDCDSGKEYLYGKETGIDDIIWMGAQPSLAALASRSGISNHDYLTGLQDAIAKATNSNRNIHILPPYRPENKLRLAALLGVSAERITAFVSLPLIKAVVAQREIKEAIEIEQIEEAVDISVEMHVAAMQYTKPGMKEYEVAAKVEEVALSRNGRLSYPTILTINGQTLHNHYHGNTIKAGDIVLCDAGAENSMHYAGDLTRTFPAGKTFDSKQKAVYEIVLDALTHAAAALRPGIQFAEVHLQASIKLLSGLKSLGLVKGDPVEAAHAGVHTLFFQCGLGHMMGLDVHDMEDLGEAYVGYDDSIQKRTDFGWKSLRLGKELRPGFVLTVEPGIYFIPELIERWQATRHLEPFVDYNALQAWKNFGGVRIENNYLITGSGSKLLGKPLAMSVKEVEALRAG